jgi:hypothetical protein
MASYFIIPGIVGLIAYKGLKNSWGKIWSAEFPRLFYYNGILTENSILIIFKSIKKNLKHRLVEETQSFIKKRQACYETNPEEYKKVIDAFESTIYLIIDEIILETLNNFGINIDQFNFSLDRIPGSLKLVSSIKKLHENITPKSEYLPIGLSVLKVIIIIQDYSELITQHNGPYGKYFAIDALWKKYEVTELDLALALKLYKNSPHIKTVTNTLGALWNLDISHWKPLEIHKSTEDTSS